MKIKFRPHHFLCAVGYEGKGYSAGFIKNFTRIMRILNSENGDNTIIKVVSKLDDVCYSCPHNSGTNCKEQAKIEALDEAHRKILKLNIGETLTWGDAKNRIKKYMTIENHHIACAKCEWLKYGMCERKLRDL